MTNKLAYYNEFDIFPATWLRSLSERGLIARGWVDESSILDVRADDVWPYTQAHFFAGIRAYLKVNG